MRWKGRNTMKRNELVLGSKGRNKKNSNLGVLACSQPLPGMRLIFAVPVDILAKVPRCEPVLHRLDLRLAILQVADTQENE